MDDQLDGDGDEVQLEQIREGFLCCVCLDLLYKPIVLACGHVSCFWCVHKSMSGVHKSHCPLCRHPYNHFPSICQMLHFLLSKMYPLNYERREAQILAYEKKRGVFSPQFKNLVWPLCPKEEFSYLGSPGQSSLESFSDMKQLEFFPVSQDNGKTNLEEVSAGDLNVIHTSTVKEKKSHQKSYDITSEHVSIADVLCAVCQQLLFQPVVLNCGHACCGTCLVILADEAFRCRVCQNPHPGGSPKVFLELDNFLEEKFPEEYTLRKVTQLKHVDLHHSNPALCLVGDGKKNGHCSFQREEILQQEARTSKIHRGVGCDYCGMFPIIGDRYRCLDCMEAIGFDLCGECYKTKSKLPGRFNQQHTPEHRFKLVDESTGLFLRLLRGDREVGPAASGTITVTPNTALDNLETDFNSLSDDVLEDSTATVTSTDNIEDYDEDESTL